MLMPGPCAAFSDFDCAIGTLGELQSQSGFNWSQVTQQISMHFVTGGRGELIHRKQRYALSSGDAFCFFPGEQYFYNDLKDDLWSYTWFGIHGKLAAELCYQLGFNNRHPVQSPYSLKPLQHLITEIKAAYRSEDHSPYFPQAAAWRLFDLLSKQQKQFSQDQIAEVLRRILDETYTNIDISINQIAQDLHVDRSTLFRHFQRVYNMAPKQYLEKQRMRHAKSLLRGQHLSIKDIALHCGYEDPQYFSRVFRKHFQMSPTQYTSAPD